MRIIEVLLYLLVFLIVTPAFAQQEVSVAQPGDTCSHHGQECLAGCRNRHTETCQMICNGRVSQCVQTGTYVGDWKTYTGLERR